MNTMMSSTQYQQYPTFTGYQGSTPAPMLQQPTTPRPAFFISRSNGLLVPLIPADELPFNVRLHGLQRVMQIEQTYGMQYVGSAPYTGMTYKLEQDISPPMQRSTSQPPGTSPNGHARSQSNNSANSIAKYLAPDALARQALAQSANNAAAAANRALPAAAHETATDWRSNYQPQTTSQPSSTAKPAKPGDKTQSLIDAIISSTAGAEEAARIGYVPKSSITPPSGALPDQDKKEYCTYWIRTGECDYIQQGCLYKHEMPDRATLAKIGFRTMPRWWAEKQMLVNGPGPGEQRERVLVGPVIKAEEWLKKKPDSDATSSSSESVSDKSSRKSSISSTQETVKEALFSSSEEVKATDAEQMATPPTCTLPPTRRTSAISDLIDFETTQNTTPSSPVSSSNQLTPALTPANSAETSARSMPAIPPITAKTATTSPEPVFVPRGENAECHIAEATKKRQQQQQFLRRGAPVSEMGVVKDLGTQIQEARRGKKVLEVGGEKGLMASRHAQNAPGGCGGDVEERGRSLEKMDGADKKRSPRTGCRPRRPAGSCGKANGAEKGKGAAGKDGEKGKGSPKMMILKKGEVVSGAESK